MSDTLSFHPGPDKANNFFDFSTLAFFSSSCPKIRYSSCIYFSDLLMLMRIVWMVASETPGSEDEIQVVVRRFSSRNLLVLAIDVSFSISDWHPK